MLTKIEVLGNGWHLYKQDTPIPEGYYYQLNTRAARKLTKEMRKSVGAMAVTDADGTFRWLCPFAPWVKRVLVGMMDLQSWRASPIAAPDWGLIGIDPAILRPWQREFVADCYNALAHGLPYRRAAVVTLGGGKTLAGLCLCQLGEHPAVVAPRYLHETWRSEAAKWKMREPILSTYESAHKLPPDVDVLVVDEVLGLKDSQAQRSRRVRDAGRRAQVVVGFTGTPTGGRGPLDWGWLCSIAPGSFPESDTCSRFLFGLDTHVDEVAPGRNAYVTEHWDTDRIATFVAPYVLSVDTSDLVKHLPEIQHVVVRVEAPPEYAQIVMGVASDGTRSKILAQARSCTDGAIIRDDDTHYRLDTTPKLDAVEAYVENNPAETFVIAANWDASIDMLAERFAALSPSIIRGGMSDRELEHQIARFKAGTTRILIVNSRFSQGMNLQEVCRCILILSPSTNPVDFVQLCGRVHRPGQRRGCIVVAFNCEGTLDERTWELITGHNEMSQAQVEALLEKELDHGR